MSDDETTDTTPTGPDEQAGGNPKQAGGDPKQAGGARARGRWGAWAAVAALCVLLGAVASVLGARAVARNDTSSTRAAFAHSSKAIATTVKLAVQRQEELTVAASTYFSANPKATPVEFAKWVTWARTQRRYPELDALGVLPGPSAPAKVSGTSVHVSPAQLLSRNTGLSIYKQISAGHRQALAIQTPVYRGNVTPHTVFGRTAASVGWLRTVLVPGAMLRQVLTGHPGYALAVSYRNGTSNLVFSSGAPVAGAQSASSDLHNGWTVTSFGPAADTSVFDNANALAVLVGGILLSVLVGLVVDIVGGARTQAPTPTEAGAAEAEEGAAGDTQPGIGAARERYLYEPVTGLPNRELTLDRAERMVARAGRDSGMLAGALFVDIDQLREVNEKLGGDAGNQLLKIVGERLGDVVRTGDTVGRLDGDEFVVLVESAARGVRLDSLAQRMIEALHKPIELDDFGPSFVLTASIGVAFGRYETPDDLLRDAHVALASAKAAGKDRYTLFNANMRSVIEGRAVLEAELNTALTDGQFFLLYEPICDLQTRRVVGLEALLRWRHPTQGLLAAADFVPLAEETGLIVPIGRWALEEACGRAAAWAVAGHRAGVSVRVSANQLDRDGFATDVRRALQQSGIEPALLTLQVSEATLLKDIPAVSARLLEIKQLGVRIAIDDFGGSGYAHQADLRQMALDTLRVDRGSLAASEDEAYRRWLLEAILLVGRELSLAVIATGIETAAQLGALREIGCTMAQGGFVGEPVALEAVPGLLAVELLPVAGAMAPMPVAVAVAETAPEAAPSGSTAPDHAL
ncbi:MAG: EAL domain-containing protein [Solirubrobacteraceae bacterium]